MIYGDMTWPDIDSGSIEKVYFESVMEMYLFSFRNCPNMEKVFYMSIAPYDCVMNYDIYYPRAVYNAMTSDGSYYIGRFAANISYYYNYENAENGGYYWIDDCDYGGKIEFIPPDPVRDGYTLGG